MNNDNQQSSELKSQNVIYAYPPDFASGADDEIDLAELWNAVWASKWIIVVTTGVFACVSVLYALWLPDVYEAEVVLAPSEEVQGGGLSKMAGQLGGLASLAGISLGAGDGVDKIAVALEVMQSRKFIGDFVERHGILPDLMATEHWNPNTNILQYHSDLYDAETQTWVRDVQPPKKPEPSSWEAYEAFTEILAISRDDETNFVTVTIKHQSPFIAELWVKLIVEELNAVMKEKDVAEASRSIEYLNKQLNVVALAEMRTVFYQLIEEQIQTMMLADVRDEYIFSTIDPPVVAEEKAEPNRALISILGLMLGAMLGLMVVLVRYFIHKGKGRFGD